MALLAVLQDERRLLEFLSYLMMLMGVASFILLRCIQVPYGRYASSTFGPPVPVRLAWFVQELPSLAVPVYYLFVHTEVGGPAMALLVAFICHYVQRSMYCFPGNPYNSPGRLYGSPSQLFTVLSSVWKKDAMLPMATNNSTLIFPFLIRGGKPTPLASFSLAFIFCCYNGYLQSSYLCQYASLPANWIYDPRFIIGIVLFISGMLVNIHSDHILRNLRKPGETGYKIPIGGLFEYVSGANFFGEILEWSGFAIASWSIPGAAFAIFTLLVLLSRAQQHHQWYIEKFENYPKARKILVPFIY